MTLPSSTRDEIKYEWATNTSTAKYLAYKYSVTEKYIRSTTVGISGPKKEKQALSAYHRAVGMKLIDKRLKSQLNKQEFANMCGMSHFRLSDLEKGYDEITISELVFAELLTDVALLDTALLENE